MEVGRVLEEEHGNVFCWWEGQEIRSGQHGAGWAINVGISSPGIRTETPLAYTLICNSYRKPWWNSCVINQIMGFSMSKMI